VSQSALGSPSGAQPLESAGPVVTAPARRARRKRSWKRFLLEYSVVYALCCLALTWQTVRPKLAKHTVTPDNYKLKYEPVTFRAASEPKELWSVPRAGHVMSEIVDPDAFIKRVPAFFLEHLSS
jgi:hypothetical protein